MATPETEPQIEPPHPPLPSRPARADVVTSVAGLVTTLGRMSMMVAMAVMLAGTLSMLLTLL
jgi:hypothetical protein